MAIFVCTSSLPTTGAFSQNFGKLISELKLVSDNLLFSYIFKFSTQNHTTATHTACDKHLTVHAITCHLQFSVQMAIQKLAHSWHAATILSPSSWSLGSCMWDLNLVSKLLPTLQKLATWLKWPQVKVTAVSGFTEKVINPFTIH